MHLPSPLPIRSAYIINSGAFLLSFVINGVSPADANFRYGGYSGKLNVKNWARQVKVSDDTAGRDIKDLARKGILVPQHGRVRDVSYGISISADKTLVPGPKDE